MLQPLRRTSGGLAPNKPLSGAKPLPGAKLRPLQANSKASDHAYTNTWDPKNRPNVPLAKK